MTAHKLCDEVSRHPASALPGIVLPSRHTVPSLASVEQEVAFKLGQKSYGLVTSGRCCFNSNV